MGTIGGSVAHADPAADYPAALQALEAKIVLKGAKSRTDRLGGRFLRRYVHHRARAGRDRSRGDRARGWRRHRHQLSEGAPAGQRIRHRRASPCACASSGDKIAMARIGVTGLSNRAFRAKEAEKALEGRSRLAGRDSGRGGVGGAGNRRQLRSARLGRIPAASCRGVRGESARHGVRPDRVREDFGIVRSSVAARASVSRDFRTPRCSPEPCRAARAWKRSAKTSTA